MKNADLVKNFVRRDEIRAELVAAKKSLDLAERNHDKAAMIAAEIEHVTRVIDGVAVRDRWPNPEHYEIHALGADREDLWGETYLDVRDHVTWHARGIIRPIGKPKREYDLGVTTDKSEALERVVQFVCK